MLFAQSTRYAMCMWNATSILSFSYRNPYLSISWGVLIIHIAFIPHSWIAGYSVSVRFMSFDTSICSLPALSMTAYRNSTNVFLKLA